MPADLRIPKPRPPDTGRQPPPLPGAGNAQPSQSKQIRRLGLQMRQKVSPSRLMSCEDPAEDLRHYFHRDAGVKVDQVTSSINPKSSHGILTTMAQRLTAAGYSRNAGCATDMPRSLCRVNSSS